MACCRAFGVAILALSLGAGATRHEHPAAFLGVRGAQELRVGMVPSAISRAIQHALRDSRSHLKALTAAEKDVTRLAAEKKATADSALAKKVALEEDKRKQEEACEEEEKKSRENRMKLEKASEEHDLHSEALDKARGLWNKLNDELEFLRKGVKQQEKTLMETLYDMETALDAKKKEVEDKESETAAAELDMKEKEDKVKAAGKVKKEYEEQLIEAEKRSQQAQEALQAIRAKAEEAVDEVVKAEMEQKEAASQQKEAQALHDKGAQSSELLQKLKAAVEDFFNAIDALEASMMKKMSAQGNAKAHELILLDENLEPTLSKYNLMVVAFDDVWTYGDGSYAKVEPAIEQIVEDAKADLELICDPTRQFGESMAESPELEEKCWTALWRKVGMNEGTFPGEKGQLAQSADVKSSEMPTEESEIMESPKAKGAATLTASEESTPAMESAKALDTYMETTATSTTMGDIADLLAEDSIKPGSPAKIVEASSTTTTTVEDVADLLAEDSLSPAKTMEVSAATHTSTTPEVVDDLLAENSITPESPAKIVEASSTTTTTAEDVADLLAEDSLSPAKSMEVTAETYSSTTPEVVDDLLAENSIRPESPAKIVEASSTTTTTVEDVADLLAEDSLSPAKTMEVSAETHTSTTPEVVDDLLAEHSITPESPTKIMEASTETHATSTTTTLGDLSDLLAEDSITPKSPQSVESGDISDLLAEDSITPKSPAKIMEASTDETHATSTTTTLGDLSDLLAEDSITPKSPQSVESGDISDLLAEDSITPKSPAKIMEASTDETHATSTTTTLGDLSDLLAEDSISSPKKESMGSDSPHSPHWMEHITGHFMPSPSGTATASATKDVAAEVTLWHVITTWAQSWFLDSNLLVVFLQSVWFKRLCVVASRMAEDQDANASVASGSTHESGQTAATPSFLVECRRYTDLELARSAYDNFLLSFLKSHTGRIYMKPWWLLVLNFLAQYVVVYLLWQKINGSERDADVVLLDRFGGEGTSLCFEVTATDGPYNPGRSGLSCSSDEVVLLTNFSLLDLDGDGQWTYDEAERLDAQYASATRRHVDMSSVHFARVWRKYQRVFKAFQANADGLVLPCEINDTLEAFWSDDGFWYDARLEAIDSGDLALVWYFDDNDTSYVKKSQLQKSVGDRKFKCSLPKCIDTDAGALDKEGSTCADYETFFGECGNDRFDDADFHLEKLCCLCGGGTTSLTLAGIGHLPVNVSIDQMTQPAQPGKPESGYRSCVQEAQSSRSQVRLLLLLRRMLSRHLYIRCFADSCASRLV
ncbi:unnamed protein product [Symbiodinium sp. CCMP2592]|nr:unnamed protein product [Symbiodinium sp. CCMP2592]